VPLVIKFSLIFLKSS